MEFVSAAADVRQQIGLARGRGLTVGLVPTMGCLHDGHAELIRRAAAECGFVVVSIFVNPLQFGPREDFGAYPRDLEHDLVIAAGAGADLVFQPDAEAMYPPGFCTHVEVGGLGDMLCGASRPGHFRGVATVAAKLFNIVRPDRAFFGQKDYQQTRVLRRMVEDLDFDIQMSIVPTVRHEDGLAMSSRNAYLDPGERAAARALHRALMLAQSLVLAGETNSLTVASAVRERLARASGVRVDYVSVCDPVNLQPVEQLRGRVLVALAAFVGRTRLIDNVLVDVPG